MQLLRRLCSALLALLMLVAPAGATWSILIIDTRTGEIAIASATCVANINLKAITPVLLVNRGAATAQAAVNFNSITNRAIIWNLLQAGSPPSAILASLAQSDPGHQSRQYGIIDVTGGKVTFSGSSNSAWAGGVTGNIGTIHYAVQGNILTGQVVVTAAEQAIRNTPGDLAARLIAGMEAASSMGGDGRCSCAPNNATGCGAPPPSFIKSAHVGYMIVARQGDTDGTCTIATLGCATGSYWMDLNVANQSSASPPPVPQLRALFDAWRLTLAGRPDHHQSTVTLEPPTLIADGSSVTTATITLRDWQGTALTAGGATVTIAAEPTGTASVTLGPVSDLGNGTYTFNVTAGTTPGTASLAITVDDGVSPVLLSPRTDVEVRPDSLWASATSVSAAAGGTVDLHLDAGGGNALAAYVVAASASGTSPGLPIGSVVLPLNPDPWFQGSLLLANGSLFVNTFGALDLAGRAQAQLAATPGLLAPAAGTDLDFAYVLLPFTFASNPVRVSIAP